MNDIHTPGAQRARVGPWTGLALLVFPLVVLALDVSVLFLATPALTRDLGASATEVLWITDVYGFFIAGFLIVMGALGDRVGRRRLLVTGSVAFAAASTVAAFAPTPEVLIAARALMGLAGATLMPSTLSLIRVLFPDEQKRRKAIAIWMTAFSASMALGPVLGGLLVDALWWGAVFLLPVPLLLLFAVAGGRLLPEQRSDDPPPLDALSAVMVIGSMLGAAYVVKALAGGVPALRTTVVLAVTVVLVVLTLRRQFRVRHPLIEPDLLRDRRLLTALCVLLAGIMSLNGLYFLLPQYFQHVGGLSALHTGLLLLPLAVAAVAASMVAPMLLARMRPPSVVAVGAAVAAAGFVGLVPLGPGAGPVLLITLASLVAAGVSIIGMVMTDLVVGVAPPRHAGAAAGMSETAGELGVALGIAALGSVHLFAYRSVMLDEPGAVPAPLRQEAADSAAGVADLAARSGGGQPLLDLAARAFTTGMSWVGVVGAVALAVCATLALTVLRSATAPDEEADRDSVTS